MLTDYIEQYLRETVEIANSLDRGPIRAAIEVLKALRTSGGRLFILGVGGSAANASHAANDFRKIARIETYCPTDNVAELTAWTNDAGWETVFESWLAVSRLSEKDVLLIFSVGGGTTTTSQNLVRAMRLARRVGARILSIVSRDGGAAAEMSQVCIRIPVVAPERITPHAEGWQAVVWHLIVNAP